MDETMREMKAFRTLKIERGPQGVVLLQLDRPSKSNALNDDMFLELTAALKRMDASPEIRVIVILGNGANFCSGIDLQKLRSFDEGGTSSSGHRNFKLRREIKAMQDCFSQMEGCSKVVMAAVHGVCYGGGIDMITACDLRYCTKEASFSVKEIDFAIAADLGTLQRLPKLIGYGRAMELALTGRVFDGNEAFATGLVSGVYASRHELVSGVCRIATSLAAKSPAAAAGTKFIMLHARDHATSDSLDFTATWNAAMLCSDTPEAVSSFLERRKPSFSKL